MGTRTLIRGGSVLSMDAAVGDLPTGDVLVDGDTITAVAPSIDGEVDAEVIDATGFIVIPGFIDSHRHTWETAIRGCAPNATLDDYFVDVLDTFAPLYRAEDVYASNLAGALECVNAGITTLVDWSHINNTPEHPDAGIKGLQESGIRSQYAYGSANLSLNDYWNQSKIAIPDDDVRRIRDTYFSSDQGLITMALATRGPGFCLDEVVHSEWALARDLGIPITVHVAMGRLAGRFGMLKQLSDLGLVGPGLGSDTTYIHCCYFSDEEWGLAQASGEHHLHCGTGGNANGPWLAAGDEGDGTRPATEPVDRCGHHRARRHVHPDAGRLRVGTGKDERRILAAGRPRRGHADGP